jgi:hypothetical protein
MGNGEVARQTTEAAFRGHPAGWPSHKAENRQIRGFWPKIVDFNGVMAVRNAKIALRNGKIALSNDEFALDFVVFECDFVVFECEIVV